MVNVVFRPILLTIGLMLSMFVMHAIAFFAVEGYEITNMSIVNSTSTMAICGFLFSNLIMASLVIVLAHKSHEIIYDTADNVMKWIGFGVSPLGAVKNEQQVSSMFKAAEGAGQNITAGLIRGEGGKQKPTSQGSDRPGGGGGSPSETPEGGGDAPEKQPESGGGGKQAPK